MHVLDALCDAQGPAPLLALFLAGLAGSTVHCVPMCGPFVLAQVSGRLSLVPAPRLCELSRVRASLLLPYHLGRLITYAAIGAFAATIGTIPGLHTLGAIMLLLGAILFLAQTPWLHLRVPALPALAGAIARLAHRINRTTWSGGLLLGLTLGLLPCGLLYAAVAVATASGNAQAGGLAMLAFGAGTIPSLIAVALAGRALARPMRALAPAFLLFSATVLVLMAWQRLAIT